MPKTERGLKNARLRGNQYSKENELWEGPKTAQKNRDRQVWEIKNKRDAWGIRGPANGGASFLEREELSNRQTNAMGEEKKLRGKVKGPNYKRHNGSRGRGGMVETCSG